jgi:hypothetical protein
MRRRGPIAPALASVLLSALAGCAGTGGSDGVAAETSRDAGTTGAGLGVGLGIGLATANPLIGLLAGVAVRVVPDAILTYVDRKALEQVHARIADAAGRAFPDEVVVWSSTDVWGERVYGRLEVVREFGTMTRCREILFSVEDTTYPTPYYVAVVCRDAEGWRWAVSERAVARERGRQ